jgi:hypothetical protein
MSGLAHRRAAGRNDLALTGGEYRALARLSTPERIQHFLDDDVVSNLEEDGETILSVRQVLHQRRAHCIEAAFVAACAFWVHGKVPLVMHLDCDTCDYPHVVALFSDRGCWGAVSKSHTSGLRFRDPVYRDLRELAMSYFPAYTDKRGRRTLRTYSVAFEHAPHRSAALGNLRRAVPAGTRPAGGVATLPTDLAPARMDDAAAVALSCNALVAK